MLMTSALDNKERRKMTRTRQLDGIFTIQRISGNQRKRVCSKACNEPSQCVKSSLHVEQWGREKRQEIKPGQAEKWCVFI